MIPTVPVAVRVLLIEDDPDDAFLIEHRLTSGTGSFVVDHVGDLDDAAVRLSEDRYDVIVLDLGLPDSTGVDTVERLTALGPPCAVVVMTGAADADLASRAFALGVNDYLPKSAAATELLPRVLVHAIEREAAKAAVSGRMAAEEANLAKSAFLSRISHELRTPLHAIMGFAQLLESEATDPDDIESTGIIVKASEHLLALINDVLDLSRMETGDLSLSLGPVGVGEVVGEAMDLVRGQFGSARFDVMMDEVELPQVHGDRQRIRQVLLNLMTNALKFGPDDGTVTISAVSAGCWIEVAVADEGPGLAPEEIDVMFAPFERVGHENSTIDGVGLGLTVSRELVTAMHGEIGVDSMVGEGTRFWFRLPVSPSVPSVDVLHP